MTKKSTQPAAAERPDIESLIRAESKFNIQLGGKTHTLNFGTSTFIRIKEVRPQLPTAFDVLEHLVAYEAIPFLIECAIKPEEKTWKNFTEFLEIYDECDDHDAIAKVLTGYLSACGSTTKKLTPALVAINNLNEKGAK